MRLNGSLHGLGTSAILTQVIWLMTGGGGMSAFLPRTLGIGCEGRNLVAHFWMNYLGQGKGGRISSVLQNSLESRPTLSVAGCSTYI